MNPRVTSFLGLVFCSLFLMANIVMDYIDQPIGSIDQRWYFVPLFLMIDALIGCCYFAYRKINWKTDCFWFMFVMLSASQTTKNILNLSPTKVHSSDYLFLALILAYTYRRLKKHPNKK